VILPYTRKKTRFAASYADLQHAREDAGDCYRPVQAVSHWDMIRDPRTAARTTNAGLEPARNIEQYLDNRANNHMAPSGSHTWVDDRTHARYVRYAR
jgi:hypothetical protein